MGRKRIPAVMNLGPAGFVEPTLSLYEIADGALVTQHAGSTHDAYEMVMRTKITDPVEIARVAEFWVAVAERYPVPDDDGDE